MARANDAFHLDELPLEIADGIWSTAQQGSALARIANARPMKFGRVQVMTLTQRPKAEFVGAAEPKSSTNFAMKPRTITPIKAQVTFRYDQEADWADTDWSLGILRQAAADCGIALSRALDLGAIHGISPLQGTRYAPITDYAQQATTRVELGTSPASKGGIDGDFDAAFMSVLSAGRTPTAIAFDSMMGFTMARQRDSQGNLRYPNLGFGTNMTDFQGVRAASSDTVSGRADLVDASGNPVDSKLRAVVFDADTFVWGVQKQVGTEVITTGDPDGKGDLKRLNQLAIRMEVVYAWAWLDLAGVALVEDKVA